jgi:uncharacterized membrane protein YagU involved in acid resistance
MVFMQASSSVPRTPRPKAARAIFWGGLIAGVLDLTYAIAFVTLRGLRPIVLPQAIASGLLGLKSFEGGVPTAILGVALEFLITFVATTVYFVASRRLTFLTERAVPWGLLYGVAIYFFMNFIVVPLSAAPKFEHTRVSIASDFVVHMLFIGLPMALAVRRYSTREC